MESYMKMEGRNIVDFSWDIKPTDTTEKRTFKLANVKKLEGHPCLKTAIHSFYIRLYVCLYMGICNSTYVQASWQRSNFKHNANVYNINITPCVLVNVIVYLTDLS